MLEIDILGPLASRELFAPAPPLLSLILRGSAKYELPFQIYIGTFNQKKAHGRGLLRWREGDKGWITRTERIHRQNST